MKITLSHFKHKREREITLKMKTLLNERKCERNNDLLLKLKLLFQI